MWEMQVLSSQRNSKTDDANGGGTHAEGGEDRLSGGEAGDQPNNATAESQSPRDDEEHPAMRGIQTGTSPPSTEILASANGSQASPTSDNGGGPLCPTAALGTRKRPLLAGGPRTSMTPTKRTVMSLLARARAAQAKQLPVTAAAAFSRGAVAFDERTPTLVPLLREDYMSAVNLNLI